jgi:hypothetical protein
MSKYFDSKELNFMAPEVKENGRHMIMTNVQTETKTKYVNIDTRFQEEYNMQHFADVTFKLPQQISNVKKINVTNIEIPASFYPFSLRRRNTYFKIIDSSNNTPYVIKIDDRSYDKVTILSAIQEKLIFHKLEDKIFFSMHVLDEDVTSGDNYKLEFYNHSDIHNYTIHFNVDENGNDDKYNLKAKLGWCLGFREPVYDLHSHVEIVSEAILNVNPFTYLYISVDDFQAHAPNSFIAPSVQSYMNSNILARVSLDPFFNLFGGIIAANNRSGRLLSDTRTYEGKNDIQKLRIQILDEFGVVVDLNKMDFSFVLEIVYM